MEKLKITVEFQNAFSDKLYNAVQHAEFEWLEKHCKDNGTAELWSELIQSVDNAMYDTIKEFFDNSLHCVNTANNTFICSTTENE